MDDQQKNTKSFKLNVRSILLALLSMLLIILVTILASRQFSWVLSPPFLQAINAITLAICVSIFVLLFFVIIVDLVHSFKKNPTQHTDNQSQRKKHVNIQIRSILFTLISILVALALTSALALTFSWVLPQTLFAALSFMAFITFIAVLILIPLMVMKDLTQSFSKEPILSAIRMSSVLVVVSLLTLAAWLTIYHMRASNVVVKATNLHQDVKFSSIFKNSNPDTTYVLMLPPYIYQDQLKCDYQNFSQNTIAKLGISRSILDYWLGGEVYTSLVAFNNKEILGTTSVKTELLCTIPRPIACVRVSETTLTYNKTQNCYNVEKIFR